MPRRILVIVRRASLILILLAGLGIDSSRLKASALPDYNRFPNLSGEDWEKANQEEAKKHFELWKSAQGKARASEADQVNFYAWRAGGGSSGEVPDMIDEVLADGRLAETEVKAPQEETTVRVEAKLEVPEEKTQVYSTSPIWRRITRDAFEIWTSHDGWLFNARGDLVRHVKVKRDEPRQLNEVGLTGREWFGAFLPDGHWITTELHEGDGRVYIFDKNNRCTHEIRSGALLKDWSQRTKAAGMSMRIVPWARSTKTGEAWLVRIGSEQGEGEALLEPDGTWRRVGRQESIWKLCQPRQLGVRLSEGICEYAVESDDGRLALCSAQPGHGDGVGNPYYGVGPAAMSRPHPSRLENRDEFLQSVGHVPGSGDVCGFWPGSHAVWVQGNDRTWFFDAALKHQGWIAGVRVGDAAGSQGMIFRLKDGRCITVSPKMHASGTQRFVLPDGSTLLPLELQPDLGLGVFAIGSTDEEKLRSNDDIVSSHAQVVVARWEVTEGKRKISDRCKP